ncbi:hypothetical protein V5799_005559 [Amblyomma americanum]|uniref:Uncharacterized protein n=1 Tax=Amblyomma americanum TaxID=6943 RepID=A0AAQ4DYX0_AMBAM
MKAQLSECSSLQRSTLRPPSEPQCRQDLHNLNIAKHQVAFFVEECHCLPFTASDFPGLTMIVVKLHTENVDNGGDHWPVAPNPDGVDLTDHNALSLFSTSRFSRPNSHSLGQYQGRGEETAPRHCETWTIRDAFVRHVRKNVPHEGVMERTFCPRSVGEQPQHGLRSGLQDEGRKRQLGCRDDVRRQPAQKVPGALRYASNVESEDKGHAPRDAEELHRRGGVQRGDG